MREKKTYDALRVLKKLTDQEARGLIEVIKKGEKMSRNDIASLFNNKEISTKPNAYEIIKALHKKKVLSEVEDGFFEPMQPDLLIKDCNKKLIEMSEEIQGIKLSIDWEEETKQEKSRIVKQEHEIIHTIKNLHEIYDLVFICSKNKEEHSFWIEIKEQFGEEVIQSDDMDFVIFDSPEKESIRGGVILLSERITAEGERPFFGTLIFDPQLKDTLKKKYGKK